ncbi:MAG TPA: putative peptidoglycan glycosyltransferase FtsW [Rariglobus sp.]|nr:putative peptidoglycan glycosyltransferase FtsW [Rariglobus sp.]
MAYDAPAPDANRGRFSFNPAAIIVVCAIGLVFLGLTILFSATVSFKGGPYSYLSKQIVGVIGAAVCAFVVSRIDLEYARRHVWVVGGVAALALILVVIPGLGISVKGSRRWLGFGPIRFQVSELGKVAMVFCLAHYLALNQTRIGEFKRGYVYPLAIIGVFAGLIILEPDFGTSALVCAVGGILLFLAGAKWRYVLPSVGIVLGGFTVLVLHNENRLRRFLAFLDVEGNKSAGTYQLWQSLLAFAVGGADGVGLGQGRQQLNFLPEAHTDFIFAVIGEELGLTFTLGVVAIFTLIFVAGFIHLRRAPNLFQYLLVTGTILMICLQAIINLGVVTGSLPTKGMSMPFISAGLSNLLFMGVLIGIILNTQRTWTRTGLGMGRRAMEDLS